MRLNKPTQPSDSEPAEFPYTPPKMLTLIQIFKVCDGSHFRTLSAAYDSGLFGGHDMDGESVMCLSLIIFKIEQTALGNMDVWCDDEKQVGQMTKDALKGFTPIVMPGKKPTGEN